MTILDVIVKGGSTLVDTLFKIKKNKVKRAVDSAIDFAETEILNAEAAKINALQLIGSNPENADLMKKGINDYCDAIDLKEQWEKRLASVKELKATLEAEASDADIQSLSK